MDTLTLLQTDTVLKALQNIADTDQEIGGFLNPLIQKLHGMVVHGGKSGEPLVFTVALPQRQKAVDQILERCASGAVAYHNHVDAYHPVPAEPFARSNAGKVTREQLEGTGVLHLTADAASFNLTRLYALRQEAIEATPFGHDSETAYDNWSTLDYLLRDATTGTALEDTAGRAVEKYLAGTTKGSWHHDAQGFGVPLPQHQALFDDILHRCAARGISRKQLEECGILHMHSTPSGEEPYVNTHLLAVLTEYGGWKMLKQQAAAPEHPPTLATGAIDSVITGESPSKRRVTS